jgi:hypothetical protein
VKKQRHLFETFITIGHYAAAAELIVRLCEFLQVHSDVLARLLRVVEGIIQNTPLYLPPLGPDGTLLKGDEAKAAREKRAKELIEIFFKAIEDRLEDALELKFRQ